MTKKRRANKFTGMLLVVIVVAASIYGIYFSMQRFYHAAYPLKYTDEVEKYSEQNNLPPSLVYAVIRTESGFNPLAQSSIPARGLMQITQDTFEWAQYRISEKNQLHYDDLFDGEINIRYGTAILSLLLEEYETIPNALCAYHAGWGKTREWLNNPEYSPDGKNITVIPYEDTRLYVDKVLQTTAAYNKLYNIQ